MKKLVAMIMVIMAMFTTANAATLNQNVNVIFDNRGYNLTEGMLEFAEGGVDLSFVMTGVPEHEESLVRVMVRFTENIALNNNEAFYTEYDEYGHVLDESYGRLSRDIVIWDKEDLTGNFVIDQIIELMEETEKECGCEMELYREDVKALLGE